MSDTIAGAMVARFNASGAPHQQLSGGLWTEEVPEEAALPFGRIEDQGDAGSQATTGSSYLIAKNMAVVVAAKTAAEAERLIRLIEPVFDRKPLSYDTATHIGCERTQEHTIRRGEWRAADGEIVYEATSTWKVLVQRERV